MRKGLQPSARAIEEIQTYSMAVEAEYRSRFANTSAEFPDGSRLLARFQRIVRDVVAGRVRSSAIVEAHNELSVAAAILRNPDAVGARVTYEPSISGMRKSIDFRVAVSDGRVIFIDVKTIQPDPKDRWEQYERARRQGWFPAAEVDLKQEWLGGELWHNMTAARSRMLEYTLSLEAKIGSMHAHRECSVFILALCSNGFRWSEDELEDFVYFYNCGRYRSDDPFARMESTYMRDNSLRLTRTVDHFAYLRREVTECDPTIVNWSVSPPRELAIA